MQEGMEMMETSMPWGLPERFSIVRERDWREPS